MAKTSLINRVQSCLLLSRRESGAAQAEVRQLAAAAALPNQARRDSQGICFLGKVRFSEFIREHLGTWRGALLEEETGQIVGYHEGFWFYTLGQRRGIPLHGGPWCAPALNVANSIHAQCGRCSVSGQELGRGAGCFLTGACWRSLHYTL